MSLIRLTMQEMAAVVGRWVQVDGPARPIIMGNAILKVFMPQIDATNTRMLAVRKVDTKELKKLSDDAGLADVDHDFWVNGIVSTCDAVSPMDPDLGLHDVRQWIFPRGYQHARDSFGTEVGYAAQKETELDAARKKQLKAIVFGRQTLLEWVQNYFEAARKLGEIEAKRGELTTAAPAGEDAKSARRAWLQLIKSFSAAADIAGLSEQDYNTVFGYLNELSSRKASKAGAAPAQEPDPSPAPEPAPAPAPEPAPKAKGSGDGK